MFAFDRSALAVLAPLVLLLTVVAWSNRPKDHAPQQTIARQEPARAPDETRPAPGQPRDQTVAANLPSR